MPHAIHLSLSVESDHPTLTSDLALISEHDDVSYDSLNLLFASLSHTRDAQAFLLRFNTDDDWIYWTDGSHARFDASTGRVRIFGPLYYEDEFVELDATLLATITQHWLEFLNDHTPQTLTL